MEWQQVAESAIAVQGGAGVTAVHVERLIERDGTTSLESTDVWVDPSSRGVRLLAQATLPLRQVGGAPGGMKIFVGRDERADGKRYVQFVVTRGGGSRVEQMLVATRSDGMTIVGACGHHRVALPANTTGENASMDLSVVLPSLPRGEGASGGKAGIRTRPMRVHMSVSQTSADKEPIVAISTVWAGPEQVMTFDDGEDGEDGEGAETGTM
jgi:hypothetical protein